MSDIIFAVDSVPAIFAVSREPLIVYMSNVFAILGLRAMYFLLADAIRRFDLLKYALAPDPGVRRVEDDVVEQCVRREVPDRMVARDHRHAAGRRRRGVDAERFTRATREEEQQRQEERERRVS